MSASQIHLSPTENFIAGGLTGALSRSFVAPLDVLKIRYQLQTHRGQYYSHIPQTFYKIIRNEGLIALWKGNLIGSLLASPYSAITFSSQKVLKKYLASLHPPSSSSSSSFSFSQNTTLTNALSGALAGTVATSMTYPLDLLRSRFIAQTGKHGYHSIYHAIKSIYSKYGMLGFFDGLTPAIIGIIPYMGVQFAIYESLKTSISYNIETIDQTLSTIASNYMSITHYLQLNETSQQQIANIIGLAPWIPRSLEEIDKNTTGSSNMQPMTKNNFDKQQKNSERSLINHSSDVPLWVIPFCGLVSGTCGKFVSFPFDLIKRRLQIRSFEYTFDATARPKSTNMVDLVRHIYRTEGFLAFYKGLTPSLLKSGPSASISFVFYEAIVKLLLYVQRQEKPMYS